MAGTSAMCHEDVVNIGSSGTSEAEARLCAVRHGHCRTLDGQAVSRQELGFQQGVGRK